MHYLISIIYVFLLWPLTLFSCEEICELKGRPCATFTDASGTYDVDAISAWVCRNSLPISSLEVEKLLSYLSLDTWGEPHTEPASNLRRLLEDPTHLERVRAAELTDPLILTNFNVIVDGVHRLARAVYEGRPTIGAVYIDRSTLDNFKMDKKSRHPCCSMIPGAPIADICLYLPRERLPEDPTRRRNFLEDYFADQLPTPVDRKVEWEVLLERPASPYGCYQLDPDIREGLSWWGKGTRIRDIAFCHRCCRSGLLAIEDQWMPLSWSRCFQKLGGVPPEIILLHLDDHKDMMSPRIGKRLDGELVDYVTGNHISFMKPETVEASILSGAIGKGSIVTPLAHMVDKLHVRHLSFRHDSGETFRIVPTLTKDELLSPIPNRIGIHLEQKPSDLLEESSNYVITPDPEKWVERLPDGLPILLHIDMDFFNDRFDGNESWEKEHRRSHNPSLEEQKAIADKIFVILRRQGLEGRIIDVCIGISPSFYPAEYWPTMVPYVVEKCRELGITDF